MSEMNPLWGARFSERLSDEALRFESSIQSDFRLYAFDIQGSIAHVQMLMKEKIIGEEGKKIISELERIKKEIDEGEIKADERAEDIHSFIENILISRLGDEGKAIHAARSRNDQIATDEKLYLRYALKNEINPLILALISQILFVSEKHIHTMMSGYTHLQRAQPVSLAHHLCAWAWALLRDVKRVEGVLERMDECPLGAAALSGTTLPINREETAKRLGFSSVAMNSLDAVSDRDYVMECAFSLAACMMHLSRFCEEIVIWSSFEWGFVNLSEGFSTGSSMMPQKKNPDFAELIRARTSKVYGNVFSLFTLMKGLPLSYNRDMQEDKEAVFSSLDILSSSLKIFRKMLESAEWNTKRMKDSCKSGFLNATYLAEYLVKKGVPFRSSHQAAARAVRLCMERRLDLESLPLEEYKKISEKIEKDVYDAVKIEGCLSHLASFGSANPREVERQISKLKEELEKRKFFS